MKKGSILRYLLSSACILSLIGTGFAVWQFENNYELHSSFELKANVAAFSEEGELAILPPQGYTTFNLILEQAGSSSVASGISFIPNINITYKNYTLNVGASAYLVGSVKYFNSALNKYVEAYNPTTNQSTNQVFLETEITNDLRIAFENSRAYERIIVPTFRYIDDESHIPPNTAKGFVNMVDDLDSTQESEGLKYSFEIEIKIEFRR